MTSRSKTEEEKEAARARRAAAKLAAEQEELRQLDETMARRRGQLAAARTAEEGIGEELRAAQRKLAIRNELHDHATGFYQEIDKQAKGKALLEVTNLVVEETNQIIRDAKALIAGDPYLDRTKEFVTAGENPVYPDVVVTLRNVLQALSRADSRFRSISDATEKRRTEAATVRAALELFLNGDPGDPYVTRRDVRAALGRNEVAGKWFRGEDEARHFDFDRLDRYDLGTMFTSDAAVS